MTVNNLATYGKQKREALLDNDGIAAFQVLVGTDGIVPAKLIEGKYGMVWLLTDSEDVDAYERKFIPHDGSHKSDKTKDVSGEAIVYSRSKVQEELGLQQMYELAPAKYSIKKYEQYRQEWVEYGNWTGDLWWSADDNIYNEELLPASMKLED